MSSIQKRLKVLMLFNRVPYPLNNGGAIAMFSSVKEYAEHNCEVHILSMNTSKHFIKQEIVRQVFAPYAKVELVEVENKINLIDAFLNLFSKHCYMLERFISKKYNYKLIEMLKQDDYNIIHLDALSSLLYLDTVRNYSKGKVLYRAQNVESEIWRMSMKKTRNLAKKIYLKNQVSRLGKFENYAAARADVILPISTIDEIYFREKTAAKVILLPVCLRVNSEYHNYNFVNDIFFLGALDWFPNAEGLHWFFENIWPDISKEFPAYNFYIAGRKMPQWLHNLKSDKVIPLGEVQDAKEFMLAHGIMVAPILTGSGIRIKIVEAMALGKVVIATTVAIQGLEATDGVNILIADSAEAFIKQIRKCENEDFRRKIGENALSFAKQKFSVSKLSTVLEYCGYNK